GNGQVFGKVVDNLQPVLIYIRWQNSDAKAAGTFRTGGQAYLLYQGRELPARIREAITTNGESDLLLELSEYPDDFIHRRDIELQLVIRRLTGWLVPKDAVVFKDGRPGLYVILKQQVSWLPVTVTDRMGDTVSVTGDGLNDQLRYISNPDRVNEGTRLTGGG
ncbi:MAG: hypothetical protein FWC60_02675, partial [Firmicutes bacterium]|nr:hypothetical protein [Bacillota bacterium]